ncbi:MAG: hypothetical protein COV01_00090 [Candidatus Taylorbacteria bacterium CG10_big_fil_rev_8_21_14_0_10_41_48]|uniref:Histidine phosphatase family protein n=1 Tax=Candidatus Taylorbacteria bacterium CG10_big_fil_rev_8_21_14_0_10_41_48 TaxID=1975024 RepID=A0A2M8LCR5_9BACT|nr:MAG: hypothetical protein COV01_00090 [Candidatus Taylorbacteria bacterium CG10_big_fil_rev_8_21_14_0_10_41_48]
MILKRLIIVRHSKADMEGFLTEEGKIILRETFRALKKSFLIRRDAGVMSSPILRATESGRFFIDISGIETELFICQELFSDGETCDTAGALKAILRYARKTKVETLIVVTHFEMIRDLPDLFRIKVLKGKTPFLDHKVSRGRGVIIDCKKKIRWSIYR